MRVVVAGGSGFIGRALCRALESSGHEPVVLSRRPTSLPWTCVPWDGASSGAWQSALDGAGAIVNLAGESVAQGRWTAARKQLLSESRLKPTRALVAAISSVKSRPPLFLSASAVGFYGNRGDEALAEGSSPGTGFLAGLCAEWEREAQIAETLGVRTLRLRIGIVLGPGGGALARMLLPFRLGLGGPLGHGRQWMSWIALEDMTGLILHLLGGSLSGAVNAASPEPVTNRDFTRALGRALGRPALLPAPGFALRLALGEMAQELLLSGQRVLPERALESGYAFKRPDIASALRSALS